LHQPRVMNQTPPFFLSSFESVEPRFSASQEAILNFLKDRHNQTSTSEKVNPKYFFRYSVKPQQIKQRFFECPDLFLPTDQMVLYGSPSPTGVDIHKRSLFYNERAREIFQHFYSEEKTPPDHIIHVTCTGYVSPSAAQNFVSSKDWSTDVTHAYHMGCYAAFPAIRMAWGQSLLGQQTDLVHTEMCSLHLNPAEMTPEQIIVQTLFADGHIKYRASDQAQGRSFLVRGIKEKILPGTESDMTWMPAPWGLTMTLSKDVPQKIASHVRAFTVGLIEDLKYSVPSVFQNGLFALHPGGPRIIDVLKQSLDLSENQIQASKEILFERGNMSSATLPHIWKRILESNPVPGTPIVSLGFGPGLTMFGSVFEVC